MQPENPYVQPCNADCRMQVRPYVVGQSDEEGWLPADQLPIEYGKNYELRHSHRDENANWACWNASHPFRPMPVPQTGPVPH